MGVCMRGDTNYIWPTLTFSYNQTKRQHYSQDGWMEVTWRLLLAASQSNNGVMVVMVMVMVMEMVMVMVIIAMMIFFVIIILVLARESSHFCYVNR